MKPRVKLFVVGDGHEGVFGDGKWQLLKAVRDEGSISRAAVSLGRSYRKAWGDIKRAEEALGRPLIIRTRGGTVGGRSELTPFCEALLAAWERYRGQVQDSMKQAFRRHLASLVEAPR